MPAQEVIDIVKLYLKTLKENGITIDKAILYGSFARGEETENSDIDLMLVSELFDNNKRKYLGKIWSLTSVSDFKIEPYTISKKKFEKDDISPIIAVAKTQGYEITIN